MTSDPLLLEINNLAGHWHRLMIALSDDQLNGKFVRVVREAETIEERLERLWHRRRKHLAQSDAHRFRHVDLIERHESVFELEIHIPPCS